MRVQGAALEFFEAAHVLDEERCQPVVPVVVSIKAIEGQCNGVSAANEVAMFDASGLSVNGSPVVGST
jgi:hypothetical protein